MYVSVSVCVCVLQFTIYLRLFSRSGYKTATYKTAKSQNSDYYKIATTTKQRLLQKGEKKYNLKNH